MQWQCRAAEQELPLLEASPQPGATLKNDPNPRGCRDHGILTWDEQQIE